MKDILPPKYAIHYWLGSGVLANTTVSVDPYVEEQIVGYVTGAGGLKPQAGQGVLVVDMIHGPSPSGWAVHEEDERRAIVARMTGLPLRDKDFDRCCQIDPATGLVVAVIHCAPEDHAPRRQRTLGHDFVLHRTACEGETVGG